MHLLAKLTHNPHYVRSALLLLLFGILGNPNLLAQSSGLSGVVTDETGGVIPGAAIDVMNEENGFQRSASSNEEGIFTFAQLPPGSYTLSAIREGFTPVLIEGVSVLATLMSRIT